MHIALNQYPILIHTYHVHKIEIPCWNFENTIRRNSMLSRESQSQTFERGDKSKLWGHIHALFVIIIIISISRVCSNHDIHCLIFIRTRRIDLKRSVLLNRSRSTFSIIASSSLARSFLSKLIIILSIFFVTQTSQFLTLNFFSPFGQIFPNLQSNWFSGENTFCN